MRQLPTDTSVASLTAREHGLYFLDRPPKGGGLLQETETLFVAKQQTADKINFVEANRRERGLAPRPTRDCQPLTRHLGGFS